MSNHQKTMMMDSLLPGLAPTGRRVEIAIVVIVGFDPKTISCRFTCLSIRPK